MGEKLSQQFSDEGSRKALARQVTRNRAALLVSGLSCKEPELPLGCAAGLFVGKLFGKELGSNCVCQFRLDPTAA